jgi:hypothetical protein
MSPSVTPQDFGWTDTQMLLMSLLIENKCKDVIRAREREVDAQLTSAYADGFDDGKAEAKREFESLVPATLK